MSGWFGGILGQREAAPAAEILIERLQDSHKIEDRKKAVADLKNSENKDNHATIGKAIPVLVNLMISDRGDLDIIRDTLELLLAITTTIPGKDNSVELQNTDIFIKDSKNLHTVLGLLEEKDYYIRYSTTQFVTTLLANRSSGLQDAILLTPMGILNLMDLLGDNREAIRNEVLLLLLELTQTNNQEIQKIVAFQGAFEKLLDIIQSEGASDGGIIVQDCLKLISNLLRGNVSNQNYFREIGCIKRLPALLEVQNTDMFILTDSKHAILLLALDLITLLVHGSNPSSYSSQTVLAQNNMISLVVRLALGRMHVSTIRCKALQTLGELIRGHAENLTAFAGMNMLNETTKQTQSALMKLVLVMLTSKDLGERLAALHTLQCYLASNEEGQLALASTVTPSPTGEDETDVAPSSIGGHLLKGLLGWLDSANPDSVSSWLSAGVLSAILKDNNASKELLLRIPLEIPKPNAPLVTLMTKTMRSLYQSDRLQDPLIRVGLLRMVCVWLEHSPASVKAFLATSSNLTFLVDVVMQPTPPPPSPAPHIQGLAALMIGLCYLFCEDDAGGEFSKNSLQSIIMHRIGDKYFAKLDALRKTEDFTFAEQGNQDKDPTIRYYDYDFTLFYKDSFDKIQRELRGNRKQKDSRKITPTTAPPVPHPTSAPPQQPPQHPSPHQGASDIPVLATYKELVRRLESELSTLQEEHRKTAETLAYKDQEIAKLAADLENAQRSGVPQQPTSQSSVNQAEYEQQARVLQSLSEAYNQLDAQLQSKETEIANLTRQLSQAGISKEVQSLFLEDTDSASASSLFEDAETTALKKQIASLQEENKQIQSLKEENKQIQALRDENKQIHSLQEENKQLRTLQEENKQLQAKLAERPAPGSPQATPNVNPQVIEDNRRLHEQLTQLSNQYNQLYAQYGQLMNENTRIAGQISQLNNENTKLKAATKGTPGSPSMNDQVQQLNNTIQNLQSQLQQAQAQLQQPQQQLQQTQAQLNQSQGQLQQAQARIVTLEASLAEKEKEIGRKSPMPVDNSNLRIAKLEMLLKERDAKYDALEKEQADLVQCLTNTELENINLKERLNILEGTNN